ncbi:hypothetical protein [Kitasatospora sp. NPDC017646]|uniref:hypothetical protein n=1 Tax=Kitasatospora sp. NPDC017646 TaxID=3364024 RepID=UPI0037A9416F
MIDVIYRTSRKDVEAGRQSPRHHDERTFMATMQGILVSVAELTAATQVALLHAGPILEFHRLPGAAPAHTLAMTYNL